MSTPVRWGFLGAGAIARDAVGPALAGVPGAVLHAAAARDPRRAEALGAAHAYDDYQALLDDADVEVVYIALHTSAHREWAAAALRAGKHVLCEKPLAVTAAEVRELIDTARDADRLLVEAMWSWWHPRMRELVACADTALPAGARHVEAVFAVPEPAADNYRHDAALGGGALLDLGCYAVSAASALVGDDVQVEDVTTEPGPGGADRLTRARLRGRLGVADVRAEFAGPPSVGTTEVLTATVGGTTVSWSSPVFLTRDVATAVEVTDGGGTRRIASYDPVDAYRTMVAAVTDRLRGGDAWLLSLERSLAFATTLDTIREWRMNL